MLNFRGSLSKQMLHYIDTHLGDKSIDSVILHIGENDLLNYNNSQSNIDRLMSINQKIIGKCKGVGVRNIFMSGLVYAASVSSRPITERIHKLNSNYCREDACFYIDLT